MAEFAADLSGHTTRLHPDTGAAAEQRRAGINIAAASLAGGWPREDLVLVLQILGLARSGSAGRYGADGERETRTDRLSRTPARQRVTGAGWAPFLPCPTCGRGAGQPCRSIRHRDGEHDILWPHSGRKQSVT
jgi:hypothetical protein